MQARPLTVRVSPIGLHFSLGFNKYVGEGDNYLHFEISEGQKLWYLLVNNDPDGFPIHGYSRRDSEQLRYSVNFRSLSAYIANITKHALPVTYYLQDTGREVDGRPLLEMLTAKPVSEIGKG